MSNRHLYWLAGLLTAVALSIFFYKLFILHFPLKPDRLATAWRIEARVDFNAHGSPVRAELMLPKSTENRPIYNESFVSGDYGRTTRVRGDNRQAVFSIARAEGGQVLFYRATVELANVPFEPRPEPPPRTLRRAPMPDAEQAAAKAILDRLRPRAADIPTLVALLVQTLHDARPGGEAEMLLKGPVTNRRVVDAAVRILRFGGIPARRVNGLQLTEDRRQAIVSHWIEAYVGDRWRAFQASDGSPSIPPNHMVWWRGGESALELTGADDGHVTFSVSMAHQFAIRSALQRGHSVGATLADFSLFGLPFQTQQVYRVLMVVPVGIFLLVILRNVIGIRTFGTFMPVLIAMAFRQTHLLWGLVLFSAVVFIGMAVRFYLEHLKLLLVPRLAAIVIVVIGVMALMSTVSFKLGFFGGLSVALFPIVILTMTIERMTVVWDERGAFESLTQAAGSVTAATVCYLAMNQKVVEHLCFVFPELLLILLAATLLLGRYSGYRLTELSRFRVLAEKDKP